ncbi:hypothetical protein [Azotobacter chroococcum]|uniref:hypothetical protein n=1 Tax=Azotobacter chroococcum TaxID=353 RepID=UPI00130E1844|nr:hypothetical protein [Azotobacter chroococcum]
MERFPLSRLHALAHHGLFLTSTLQQRRRSWPGDFDGFVFAGSHKHSRLPIPYGKGESVSCVSGGLSSYVLKRLPAAKSVEDYEGLLPWNCTPTAPL